MFDTIVVPLDAEEPSEYAVPLAAALARKLGDRLVVLSVVPDLDELHELTGDHEAALRSLQARRISESEAYLRAVATRTATGNLEVVSAVHAGPVVETILQSVKRERAGLIAIATHGRVGPQRWFLGSVADQVVRTSPIPVLLVRPGEAGVVPSSAPSDVIVPLDGSPTAEAALPLASALAAACGTPLTLVRAIPTGWWNTGSGMYASGMSAGTPDLITAVETGARDYLEATARRLRADGMEVRTKIGLFRAADLLVDDVASSCEQPLVVMTSHGRSGFRRMVLGSVADRIIRSATAPVIVIPDAEN
jgi:nucleotide-binding universal stress UspA family protein